jgi:hypothetical protein
MRRSIQNILVLGLLLCGNPGVAADASEIRAFDTSREIVKRGNPAPSVVSNPFSSPADGNAPTVMDCLSGHEDIRAYLKLTASEATLSLRMPDDQMVVCKATPTFTDGRKAVNPYYGASFRLGRCVPELSAAVAGKLRADVGYRMTLFDAKSSLDWIAQSAAKTCAVRTNGFARFFAGNERR